MRGADERSGKLFSYVDLEKRVPEDHPLRAIRVVVNGALSDLDGAFAAMYAPLGRPSIPPEKLLRASLLQAFYTVRSVRQLMERLEFDLLFRWFVGYRRSLQSDPLTEVDGSSSLSAKPATLRLPRSTAKIDYFFNNLLALRHAKRICRCTLHRNSTTF
jgi:hypothetical protein